jgi:uncharacterized membrane protein YfcA
MFMDYVVIWITAFIISAINLYAGFGLGMVLLPVFALFSPIEIAIGMTAVVHLLNNLFKLILLGKHANKSVVLKFGLPAILAVFGGAWLLLWFFGGFSGHQGALRSAFLLRAGLTKETFIAAGVVISCLVDISPLFIYSSWFGQALSVNTIDLLLVAFIAAFLGVFLANRYLRKVTMRGVQIIVSVMLFGIALGLRSGLI